MYYIKGQAQYLSRPDPLLESPLMIDDSHDRTIHSSPIGDQYLTMAISQNS